MKMFVYMKMLAGIMMIFTTIIRRQKARDNMELILGLLLIGWFINIIHAIITNDWNDPLI